MLSIKHVEENGNESVVSVVSVSYDSDKNELTGYGSPGPSDGVIRFTSGHVFVMNEHGKTVAAYNFRVKK